MKPTHQQLIEKIMEVFKEQEGENKTLSDIVTKSKIEHIYNEFLKELEEQGYKSIKKLTTAVQDNAIQENREMIRELKNHLAVLSTDVALMNKRLLNLEEQHG